MENAVQDKANFACFASSTEGDEEEASLKTLDYLRLNDILWTVCRDLNNRLIVLETANKSV